MYILEVGKWYSFYTQNFHTTTPKQHTSEIENQRQENNLNKQIKNLLSDNL